MTEESVLPDKNDEYNGIGGWLAFLALGIIVTPVLLALDIKDNLSAKDYGTYFHNNWIIPSLTFFDALFIVLYLLSIYFLFKHNPSFRRLSIHLLWTKAIVSTFFANSVLVDMNNALKAGTITKSLADSVSNSAGSNAGRAILAAIIWIPYLRRSKRIKATFSV